jgi:hypothetical protein
MSAKEIEQPFDTIESAHDFMNVLAETILDSVKDLDREKLSSAKDGEERRAQAVELALFKLKLLNCHVHKCRIILNDLRTVRRLLFSERPATTTNHTMAAM